MTHSQQLLCALTKVAGRPQPIMSANAGTAPGLRFITQKEIMDADTVNPAVPSPVTDAIRQNRASMSQSYAAEPETTSTSDSDADSANEWFEDNDNQKAVNAGIRGTQTGATIHTPPAKQDSVWAARMFGFGEGLGQGAKNLAGAFKPIISGVTEGQRMFGGK